MCAGANIAAKNNTEHEDTKKDNLALYEKIRFLQVNATPPAASSVLQGKACKMFQR